MSPTKQDITKKSSANKFDSGTFLPDFCAGKMVLAVVLVAELVAIILALAGGSHAEYFWADLASLSLLLLWLGLVNAAALCVARKYLQDASVVKATTVCLALTLLVCALIFELTYRIGHMAFPELNLQTMFPSNHGQFILRNMGICLIVTALMLRYFYVTYQWRINVEAESRARVHALQARIRPHFLFNSMNTIAELTRSNPELAEQAVEDLADLFRATLADSAQKVRLKEELEMARIYQRIEQLRIGNRLTVIWNIDTLPMRALIPGISIQPLLENAIYHGIEPLPEGGEITVEGEFKNGFISIMIRNPVTTEKKARSRSGNQIALDNVRQRFELAYDGEANVKTSLIDNHFVVYLRFPFRE